MLHWPSTMVVMNLARPLIAEAFHMHGRVYNDQKLWNIPYHVECWERAKLAFEGNSVEDFQWVYTELRNRWQAFRGASSTPWSPSRTLEHLQSLDVHWRSITLSDFGDQNIRECWGILESLSEIKPLKYGPSVVAISKVLHFWNPRLFVIVDDAVVWRWVFAHKWLWRPVAQQREHVIKHIGTATATRTYGACDLTSYLAILRWCGEVMRQNPDIGPCFADHVRRFLHDRSTDLPLETYDAAAMEWLLLGIVEVPPAGIEVDILS